MRVQLENIAEILAGQIMNRVAYGKNEAVPENAQTAVILQPSAIVGGFIALERLGIATEYYQSEGNRQENTVFLKKDPDEDETLKRKLTRARDLILKLSSPYDCGIVTADAEGLLVPSFCAIIRIKEAYQDSVYPSFLCGMLNHKRIREILLRGSNTGQSMVRMKTLAELEIDLPPYAAQEDIGWTYFQSCRRRWMLQCMVNNQQKISDAIMENILSNENKKGDGL